MATELVRQGNGAGRQEAGLVRRDDGAGGLELSRSAEMASSAAAAQAEAMVKAQYAIAYARPRDIDEARTRILRDCKRPGFAEVALYAVPRGGKTIEGLSIRAAESMIRAFGNISVNAVAVYDDPERRIVRVSVIDMESNVPYSTDLVIEKTVERKKLKDGQVPLGQRLNSYGDVVFLVGCTDDEMAVKQAALVSKAIRTLGLRLIPGDILDEAETAIRATRSNESARDPDAHRKAILDGFASLGVYPKELVRYLGHSMDTISPAEIDMLKKTYRALKEGEATWAEILEAAGAEPAKGTLDLSKAKGGDAAAHQGHDESAATMRAHATAKADPEPPPAFATPEQCEALLADLCIAGLDEDKARARMDGYPDRVTVAIYEACRGMLALLGGPKAEVSATGTARTAAPAAAAKAAPANRSKASFRGLT